MALTQGQRQALKTALLAEVNAELQAAITGGNDTFVAAFCNAKVTPDYWVWGTKVDVEAIYHQTGPGSPATEWNWTVFKNQSQGEQGAWLQMFRSGFGYFHLNNFRRGVHNIFGGAAGTDSGRQRLHTFGVARRTANFLEKTLATVVTIAPADAVNAGNNLAQAVGSAANPALMTAEGEVGINDIALILRG